MKKKKLFLLLALVMALSLTACESNDAARIPTPTSTDDTTMVESSTAPEAPVELLVFAAASMTETLNQIIELYKSVDPNVTITPTYDSSGTLQTQIEEGAYCDIFISAAQKQMNSFDVTKDAEVNPDKQDLIDPDTRINILENKVVLVVPEGNPANITSFSDITEAKLIALGNTDVPVGSYSLDIIKYLGLEILTLESAGKVTYGSNVKEVTTQVREGIVDCGIIYATDAYSAGLTIVSTATKDMCKQIVYPAAVLKSSKNAEAAKAFLGFLKTDDAMKIFESVGFLPVK